MKLFIKPENARERESLSAGKLMLSASSGDEYVLIRDTLLNENTESSAGLMAFCSDSHVSAALRLYQLQDAVEGILTEYKLKIHALYKELTTNDLSYYILLSDDSEFSKQTILNRLYESAIEDLRKHNIPSYFIFFPKEQEALLIDTQPVML